MIPAARPRPAAPGPFPTVPGIRKAAGRPGRPAERILVPLFPLFLLFPNPLFPISLIPLFPLFRLRPERHVHTVDEPSSTERGAA